ncbi:MAG: flagellar basal body rod protein FlgC [Desulfovibrionaceae bacterium]
MNFIDAIDIAGSALRTTKVRLNVTTMNLANMNTTRSAEGGPYRKRSVLLTSQTLQNPSNSFMDSDFNRELRGVRVTAVVPQNDSIKRVYDPSHPDADTEGYVEMPNINMIEEMTQLMNLQRLYEANTTAIESAKSMYMKALQIGQ